MGFFERVFAAGSGSAQTAHEIVLRMEMGRLCLLAEKYDKAAENFGRVLEALDHPAQFGLDETTRKALLGEERLSGSSVGEKGTPRETTRDTRAKARGSQQRSPKRHTETADLPGRKAADTYGLMGEAFLLAGQPERARVLFEKSHQAFPDRSRLEYDLAQVDLKMGRPEKALERLAECFSGPIARETLGPCRLLAEALDALHRGKELIPRLERLRAAVPQSVPIGFALAEKYFEAQRLDKAEPLYRELIGREPALSAYRNLLAIYRKSNRPDRFLKTLGEAAEQTESREPLAGKEQAVADEAKLVQLLIETGVFRGEISRPAEDDVKLAQLLMETAEKRLKADPKSLSYGERFAAALLASDAKKFDTAARFFELAIQSRPDCAGGLLYEWGLGLLVKEQYSLAADIFRRGVDIRTPSDQRHIFQYYLAGALELSGRTEEALVAARKAAELANARDAAFAPRKVRPGAAEESANRESPRFAGRVAWVLHHAKRYDEAAKAYTGLIEKFASDYNSSETREVLREARLAMSTIAVARQDNLRSQEWWSKFSTNFPTIRRRRTTWAIFGRTRGKICRERIDLQRRRWNKSRKTRLTGTAWAGHSTGWDGSHRPWRSWRRRQPRNPTRRFSAISATRTGRPARRTKPKRPFAGRRQPIVRLASRKRQNKWIARLRVRLSKCLSKKNSVGRSLVRAGGPESALRGNRGVVLGQGLQ